MQTREIVKKPIGIKKILDPAKTRAAKHGVLLISKIIGDGDPGYDIVRFVHSRKNKFDLIVIGARCRRMIRR